MKKIIQTSLIFLSIVFAAASFAKEFSADMISQMGTGNITGKIYFKNPDTTRSEMMGMISITKGPLVYQIFTSTKKYHVSNIADMKDKNPMADAGDFKTWIKKNNMKKIGKESVSGYKCLIYKGALQMDQSQSPTDIKLWYSEKLNYPVKTEITLPAPMGAVTSYLENIQTGKQPASLFAVPENYTEAASMEEAMGMPNMGAFMNDSAPGDGTPAAGQKMPSKEEMDEMMKQLQEMMNQVQPNNQ